MGNILFGLSEQGLWKSVGLRLAWIFWGAKDPTPESLLLTRIQKTNKQTKKNQKTKPSQQVLSINKILWDRSYKNMLFQQSLESAPRNIS